MCPMHPEPIAAVPLAIVDVETTGLFSDSGDRVCEVAVGRVEPGENLEVWSALANPGRPIDPEAGAVNGIRDEDVRDAPSFAALIPTLDGLLSGALMVAHNAPFDVGFLTAEYVIAHAPLPDVPVLDTLALARRKFRFHSNGLTALATEFGIHGDHRHRAAGDVVITYGVLQRMIEQLTPCGCLTVGDFLAAQGGTVAFQAPLAPGLPEPLGQAIHTHQPVTICYVDGSGRSSERVVDPLWVNHTYLIAYCRMVKAQRTFRLDRIVDAWLF
jgi:DNA polymerase III subunit epsilon